MLFRSNFVSAAKHPGIFGRTVLAELFEQFLEARVELANGAVAVEAERDFVRRRHGLVYAGKGASRESGLTTRRKWRVARDEWRVPEREETAYTRLFLERVRIPLNGNEL